MTRTIAEPAIQNRTEGNEGNEEGSPAQAAQDILELVRWGEVPDEPPQRRTGSRRAPLNRSSRRQEALTFVGTEE